jgi:sigma-E factor negative regulatory protein RseA
MVMNENISRLMDGELEHGELDAVCGGLKQPGVMATWVCYHVIGDALRGAPALPPQVTAQFVERFAAEPTILAPQRRAPSGVVTWAWAVAATIAAVTVVGWTALSVVGEEPAAMAKAREATTIGAARFRPSTVPADYLLAHQEYSPSAAIQGVGPYLRVVASPVGDRP